MFREMRSVCWVFYITGYYAEQVAKVLLQHALDTYSHRTLFRQCTTPLPSATMNLEGGWATLA
jgi:hypothetical protein